MLERNILVRDVEVAVGDDSPEVIEHYFHDSRGPSCLILGWPDLVRPLHVQVAYTGDTPWLVTLYEPDRQKWENFRQRRA